MNIKSINEICKSTYGHNVTEIDPTTALCFAEAIFKIFGMNVYKRIANARKRIGKGTDFPTFGSPLFKLL